MVAVIDTQSPVKMSTDDNKKAFGLKLRAADTPLKKKNNSLPQDLGLTSQDVASLILEKIGGNSASNSSVDTDHGFSFPTKSSMEATPRAPPAAMAASKNSSRRRRDGL